MGKGRQRHIDPFYRNNRGIFVPKEAGPRPVPAPIHQQRILVPTVEATRDIKITDKTISFIVDALDCCVEKVVKEYVPYFQSEGYQLTVTLQKGAEEVIKLIPRWVVLLRLGCGKNFNHELGPSNTTRIIQHLQRLGVRVVYYLDDFMVASNGNAPVAIASLCDAVIVATSELKNFFQSIHNFKPPIIHVPTHIDIPMFDVVPTLDYIKNIPRYKVLMTSSGRVGATGLFEICEKANDIEAFKDIQIVVNSGGVAQMRSIINSFRHLHKTYVDSIPLNDYYGLCKSVDVIINPAANADLDYLVPPQYQTTWLNSKSALKYTMSGGARIPIISSPMRSYLEAIKDGETGYIVNSPDEFIEKILFLKDNPTKAARMGIAARQDVMANYDIRKRYAQYRDAIIGDTKIEEKKVTPTPVLLSSALVGKRLFIPSIDGGPGSFYANMRKYLPIISEGQWSVTNSIKLADLAIALAFLSAGDIFAERESRGLKYIYRLDGLPMNFQGELEPTNLKIMQELFRHASALVWQSKHCQDMWVKRGLIPVEVNCGGPIIHNGVDTSIFTRRGNKLPGKQVDVLHINWSTFQHKRVDLLEKVIEAALTLSPNLHFNLLGNYVDTNPETNAKKWEKYTNTSYLGQVTDRNKESLLRLSGIYKAADIFLFTSEMEGSPNTLLEAVATGLPIVYNAASSIVPEICGDSCIGFTDESDFFHQYPRVFTEVMKVPTLREEFTMQHCVREYLKLMNTVVK